MIEERAQLYEHVLWLAGRLTRDAASGHVDPATAATLAECMTFAIEELRDGEASRLESATADLPALARWMRLATTNTRRRAPLEVAAAWEASALLREIAGDPTQAAADRSKAHAVAA